MNADVVGEPYFSVVIPTYNRAGVVGRAIESCLAQTFTDFEVIVVDDGSADDTQTRVLAYRDARVIYVRQENAGASAARNLGAELSRGRFLAFLDSDDEFLPGKLRAFHTACEECGRGADTAVWYSPLLFQRGPANRLTKPRRAIADEETVGDYLFAYDGMLQTSTLVVPRGLFLRVRFDPRLQNLEDFDLCIRLEADGARFRMLREPYVIWYDDMPEGRLSYQASIDEVKAWAEANRSKLSERAFHGLLARHTAAEVARSAPLAAMGLLLAALRHRSISLLRASSLMTRGTMPGFYGRVRDALVTLRQARARGDHV
jgi:glycosyltransferase involved in cell wall biosynthesis